MTSKHKRRFRSQTRRTWHFARSAKRETRGGEKNKAPVASPLFWLFRPRLRPQILTDGGHIKRTHQKLKTRSINRQQHKPQEITTTRTRITFNNVRLSKAKTRFAQSKFSSCPNSAARKKRRKTWGDYHLTEKSGWGVESIMVSDLSVYRRNTTSVTV